MDQRINKPRVFLSHSKKDAAFIEKLADDLRKSQIEPWLDSVDIRHGKSWQDSIFETGIPTCDAIMVYLTERSIQSAVVKKEIDVALLQTLQDNLVAFLAYVSDEKIRHELRPDLQALQVPEWNEANYAAMLPRVVAEIWRSYLERTLSAAVRDERLKRVEAELELQKYRSQPEEVFSKSENKEFEFIRSSLDKTVPLVIDQGVYEVGKDFPVRFVQHEFDVQLLSITSLLSDFIGEEYRGGEVRSVIFREALELIGIPKDKEVSGFLVTSYYDPTDELLMHGLIERYTYTSVYDRSEYLQHRYELTKKYFRYRFWLAYNQKLPECISIEAIGRSENAARISPNKPG